PLEIDGFTSGLDEIHLDDKCFKNLGLGTDDGTALKKGMFVANYTGLATKKFAQIVYEKDTGELYYDADGKGGKEAIHFATLTDQADLFLSDFFII
ncbi:MAG TPA: calcium-binding protein, partial [Microvirga sp.]|nr:calcium-binding protein [Microvirga sp.]HEX2552760.1 calcium-binding protein [Microvirga sp.]